MVVASLSLAAVMFYSAYCKWTGHPIPWAISLIGGAAALVLVLVGRTIRLPGRD
jgi:hypothetical protein